MKNVKYEIRIVGEHKPYICKWFETEEEARDFIKVLKQQDKILDCNLEYEVKEFEVR